MIAELDTQTLREASGLVARRMGLNFPEARWADLERGLKTAGRELGFEYPGACLRWLGRREHTAGQIEALASYLTIGETYFYRDPESFEALEQKILPPLIRKRAKTGRVLRLWSAGCCTGEEAYSLAIACARALPDPLAWNVSILATDINQKFLTKAEIGVYTEWSFRNAPDWLRKTYFSSARDEGLAIDPAVKHMVRFGYLNLAVDVYPTLANYTNAMDVIFCRNVLMYLTPEHQHRIAAALHRCLVEDGCLLVNPVEASALLFPMFAREEIDGVIIYRKTSRPPRAGSRPALSPAEPVPSIAVREPASDCVPESVAPELSELPVPVPESTAPIAAASRQDPLGSARIFANQGKLEEALIACRVAIAAERSDPVAHFLFATICHELSRYDEAIAAMGKVLYLDQDFILAHYALGGLYRRFGKPKESERHFGIALKILSTRDKIEIVPESDGMTCGRLMESIQAMTKAMDKEAV